MPSSRPDSHADAQDGPAVAQAAARGEGKRAYVRAVFEQIAPTYDLLNHLLSLNIDRRWRRQAIAELNWQRAPTATYLDLCSGTMDVAAALAATDGFSGRVVAADFAEPMLRAGRYKAAPAVVAPVVSDAVMLPFRDCSLAGALIAFGARNLANMDTGIAEARRVLAPGARLVILEFTTPRSAAVRAAYHAYFHRLLPFIGGALSGHRSAYEYLPRSVANFPAPPELATAMRVGGFESVRWRSLSLGIAAIHVGTRR